MTSLLSKLRERRQDIGHRVTRKTDDDILELKHNPPFIIQSEPNQLRTDELGFHEIMSRHRQAHNKVRYRQLTSGAT